MSSPSFVERKEPSFANIEASAKRVFDLVVGVMLIVVCAPSMIIISMIIKIDSTGPIFYRQLRHGKGNQTFAIYKFRTMRHRQARELAVQAVRDDARVTRFGRFLRRSSLDELPQLFNVLKGEMSLVGPRPHPVWLNDRFAAEIPGFEQRHAVRPGITGLAQICGLRGETSGMETMRDRVRLDLRYIETWSLWLDVTIIAKTVILVWFQDTAF